MAQPSSTINFTGHQYFRSRLVLSILSGKHLRITKIRSEDKNPGLRGAGLLKLVFGCSNMINPQTLRSVSYGYWKKWRIALLLKFSVTGVISFTRYNLILIVLQVLPSC